MIWDEFLRHFHFCDEEDSGLSDEEQERKGPKNRPKHTRKQIHQAKKNFLEKFKTASQDKELFQGVKGSEKPILLLMETPTELLSFNSCERSEHNSFLYHWHFADIQKLFPRTKKMGERFLPTLLTLNLIL